MGMTWGTFRTDLTSSLLARFNWFVSPGSTTWHLLTHQEGFWAAEIFLFQPQNLASDIQSQRFKYVITWYCPEIPAQLMDVIDLFWGRIRFID